MTLVLLTHALLHRVHQKVKFVLLVYCCRWVGQLNSFDNLYVGFWTLFCAASTEGWMDLTYAAVDAVGIDQQPITNHNPGIAVFFVVFMVVGAFFILNLFITVTIDKVRRQLGWRGHGKAERTCLQ